MPFDEETLVRIADSQEAKWKTVEALHERGGEAEEATDQRHVLCVTVCPG